MPQFAYTARTLTGENVAGTISAGNKRETLKSLAERSLFPLHVEEKRQANWSRQRRVNTPVLVSNLMQLADLLQNGVPLMESLSLLASQCPHPHLADILTDVRDQVAEGTPLDEAFGKHSDVFGELTVSMVRAGVEGSFLEDALKRTAEFLEKQQELKARVTGAMIYPAFLATLGGVITVLLIVFFVPKFAELFERLEQDGGGLPLPTVILLGMSDTVSQYGWFLGAAGAGGFLWLRKLVRTERGRVFVDRWKLKIPVFGPIFHGYAVSRFCRILGTLLRNGVPLLRALEISRDSAGNRVLSQAIRNAAENVSAGETLSGPLAGCGLVPRPVMAMIRVAEEANNLDEVLVGIADGIDRNTARQIDIMVRLAEPTMLLVMGMMIGFVLVALLLPVFDTMTTMG
ncbi:MAG: type II secretion system F family protein [Pirellulaceae bacterium]|nr:type II secretion system F family protein [Pirellulaceae bacterium]